MPDDDYYFNNAFFERDEMQFIMTDQASEDHGIKMLVYSRSGGGKTFLVTTLDPDVTLYVAAEPGMLTLRRQKPYRGVKITTIEELRELLRWLRADPNSRVFSNIYFDSITEVAEIVLANAKLMNADGRKAYGVLIDELIPIIKAFRDLPGRNIVMTAKQARVEDEVSKITSFGPDMPGKQLSKELPYLFDEVLRLGIGKMPDGTDYRFLQCRPDLQYEAKDRSGVLDAMEPPDLGLLFSKLLARKTNAAQV